MTLQPDPRNFVPIQIGSRTIRIADEALVKRRISNQSESRCEQLAVRYEKSGETPCTSDGLVSDLIIECNSVERNT